MTPGFERGGDQLEDRGVVLEMPPEAAVGWSTLMVPIGLAISILLVIGLTRPAARAWFTED